MTQSKLPFVTDELLYEEVKRVLTIARVAVEQAEMKLYKNSLDPFSAIFDSLRQGVSLTEWLEQEKTRQIQKTMQNAIGDFHQAILGNVNGWEDLHVGGVIDLKNDSRKIIAEVKNKHNTTKGNHKKVIYDDLSSSITGKYAGYTGYYVEVIPKSKKPYNKAFTPSDNETKLRRPTNEKIRVIDGRSFYELVTGNADALGALYAVLPIVVAEVLGTDPTTITKDAIYKDLFQRIYPKI